MPKNPNTQTTSSPCEFGVWDKTGQEMTCCGMPSFIMIEDANYCEEHYVDAVMQLKSIDPEWIMPREIEKQIEVKSK